VYNGTYVENVVVDKSINLIGEDRNTTIIDGKGIDDVIYLSVDYVNMSGFTIQNDSISYYSGVYIKSNNNNICGNIIKDHLHGIEIYGSNNTVRGNRIIHNRWGIYFKRDSDNNVLTENFIVHNFNFGVYDWGGTIVTWNVIADTGNNCPGIPHHHGIYKPNGEYNIYHHNDFFFNTQNAKVYQGYNNYWDDGAEGNYWDDWKHNPGYPEKYIIPSSYTSEPEIDWHPNANRWTDTLVADGWGSGYALGGYETVYVHVNKSINFVGKASGGALPYSWHWDFGDGNTSDTKEPTHSYNRPGNYKTTITVTDNKTHNDIDRIATVCVGIGPPYTPTITGKTNGRTGISYDYTFVVSDPDEDVVFYDIDWGDGKRKYDLGPIESSEKMILEHRWTEPGNYTVRARAKDRTYEYGPWGTLIVTMPKNKAFNFNFNLINWLERFPLLNQLIMRFMERWGI